MMQDVSPMISSDFHEKSLFFIQNGGFSKKHTTRRFEKTAQPPSLLAMLL